MSFLYFISNLLLQFFAQFKLVFRDLRHLIVNWFNKGWALILLLASFAWVAINDVKLMVGQIITVVSSLTGSGVPSPGESPGSHASWMAVANTFTPLDECLGYMIIYAHLAIAMGIYKLIKNWLPTLGNT